MVNALAPAEVTKVVLDEDQKRIEVVVPDDQLSLAIGRRGQNVRLASQLSGWDIRIFTEAQESERRQEEFHSRSKIFIDALDVDEMIAHLLVTEGFSSIEEVAFVPQEEIAGIEGFDEEIALELSTRAQAFLTEQEEKFSEIRREMAIADDLAEMPGLTPEMVVVLAKKDIKTRDQLAELAGYELSGSEEEGEEGVLQEFGLSEADGNAIIIQARAHWYEGEDEEETEGEASENGDVAAAADGEGEDAPAPAVDDAKAAEVADSEKNEKKDG